MKKGYNQKSIDKILRKNGFELVRENKHRVYRNVDTNKIICLSKSKSVGIIFERLIRENNLIIE